MDKYTVDLDQVLNDFEYSELTDQQSKNAPERPHSTTFQPAPITKHSINNVFHSLNEYLSSEIGSCSDKVRLQDQNVGFKPINLGKNDNNVCNNVAGISDLIQAELNVDKNQQDTFVDLSEHLPEPKNDLQIQNALETTQGDSEQNKVILSEDLDINKSSIENEVTDSINNPNNENYENIQRDLLNIINNISDSVIDAATTSPQEKYTTESNDILFKTDNINASLLDAEIDGSNIIPKLICTEKNVKCEFTSVDNDKDCDKIVDNKADSKIINFGENESLEGLNQGLNEHKTCTVDDSIVNISEVIESSGNSSYESAEVINEKPFVLNLIENVENFIIEPSESVYALGIDDAKIIEINENLNKVTENSFKLESIVEPPVKNINKLKENLAYGEKHDINDSKPQTISLSEETTPHKDLNMNQNSCLIETTDYIVEDISKDVNNKPGETEPKSIVGFAAELDIDDNELNKMLEDLEIEESDLNNEELKSDLEEYPVDINDEVVEEKAGIKSLELDSHEDIGKVKEEPEQDINSKDVTNIVNCQLTTTHKEICLEKPKEDSTNQDNIGTKVIECLEIEKPSKNKKSTLGKTKNHPTTAGSKQLDKLKDHKTELTEPAMIPVEEPQEVKHKTEVVVQKQKSQDSLNRPQDLPLNNEGKEGNPIRKIDLIGRKLF